MKTILKDEQSAQQLGVSGPGDLCIAYPYGFFTQAILFDELFALFAASRSRNWLIVSSAKDCRRTGHI
ncbi:hypothetical protein P280DRAFT_512313 [Massarina eburnea CBS 473.64]|uniref:Uncharacterized protein n=1 Tax=Massarina eburnea CBS 473.64 TaxID=1395130 RepID=A0A6A6SGF9_9PLEO|nr:hypothetical protein P280DRAFT_512313 [Massarina eburnea CBS 473.64]